jgi:hypothetical protein
MTIKRGSARHRIMTGALTCAGLVAFMLASQSLAAFAVGAASPLAIFLPATAGASRQSDQHPSPGVTSYSASGYGAPGRFKVTTRQLTAPDGDRYDVFSPSSYRALGFMSPIITWGNGTGASPNDYTVLLTHLASFGFTVVASTLPNTGSGREVLEGAHDMVRADHRRGSVFFHHLDVREIAAAGHSQGATGAVRAATMERSLISSVVTFSLPWNGQGPAGSSWDKPGSLGWSGPNPDCATARDCWPDPSALTQPTFLVSTRGPLDAVIANPAVERCYFQNIRAPAAWGLITDSAGRPADHVSIVDPPIGEPTGFLDYVTAWLLFRLRNDKKAGDVFTGQHPGLLDNPDWTGSMVKRGWSRATSCRMNTAAKR